ncbi:thioesterase [Streptomyces sp. 3MP-14]|uniref:Thioesterase n=1 Tax=Streptomyces mimosae TaxID=2586635 RepID=A0A5N6A0K6_9ACTN|nr:MULTISPECIES: thioesterase domain-containing protein [Streptomyces]KAB8161583.1 thioesterase [Streptomyces mimosae]KAB8173480.1 thioesterase [Streptomyces sp. 3MP-14]
MTAPAPQATDVTDVTGDDQLLIPISRTPGPLRSVLLHPAGGGLGPYLGVAAVLGRRGPVAGIRAAGLLPGERPDDSVEAMVRRYLPLLDRLDGPPDLLFGWSLGGVLAWELAAELVARGQRPRVVMLDSQATLGTAGGRDLDRLRAQVVGMAGLAGHDAEQVARTTDAHIAAVAGHAVRDRHDSRALLMACAAEPDPVQPARWRELAPALRVVEVPCGHFELLAPPHLRTVIGHLETFLRETDPAAGAPGPADRPTEPTPHHASPRSNR